MSTQDNTQPMHAVDTDEMSGAMGAGGAEAPDLLAHDGGDATGGMSPGDPDAMGADGSTDGDVHLDELP